MTNNPKYSVQAQLTSEFPGDPVSGDLFGIPLALNGTELFAGAIRATVNSEESAGASFFYKENNNDWVQSQSVFTVPHSFNAVSGSQIVSHGNWLFVPVTGTPRDVSGLENKDKAGSIAVFKKSNGTWNLVQYLENPLGPVAGAGNEFGLNLDYTGGDWLIVAGGHVSTAYLFKLNHQSNLWEYSNQALQPGTQIGNMFVAIGGDYVFVQKAMDFSEIDNQLVYVYKRNNNNVWSYLQTLQGFNNPIYPGSFGDLFGAPMHIDIDSGNAVITAPGDSVSPEALLTGAVYFLKLKQNGTWNIIQKVISDQPSLLFGFANIINGKRAVLGDPGRTIGSNPFQGAIRRYKYKKNLKQWIPRELYTDPNGVAFDYFGGGGLQLSGEHIAASSDRIATDFFGGPRGPALPGRVVIYKKNN